MFVHTMELVSAHDASIAQPEQERDQQIAVLTEQRDQQIAGLEGPRIELAVCGDDVDNHQSACMTRVGQASVNDNKDDKNGEDEVDTSDMVACTIVMNVVTEVLNSNWANKVFGNLKQLLSDDNNTLDTIFSAINAAAKEAFAKQPGPKATDADTTIALLQELEKLPVCDTHKASTTTAGDSCLTE